jgi:hypothetical protein
LNETIDAPVTPKKRVKKLREAVPVVTPLSTSKSPKAAAAATTMSSKKPITATKQQSTRQTFGKARIVSSKSFAPIHVIIPGRSFARTYQEI